MIVGAALAGFALLVAVAVPRLLSAAHWTQRAPMLAIATWQAAGASVVGAIVLAGLTLALPTPSFSEGLAGLLHSCSRAVLDAYSSPGSLAVTSTGLVIATVVALRTLWGVGSALSNATRVRDRHRDVLRLVGRPSASIQATIIESGAAAVYCVPGRSPQVVCTTAALGALSDAQLRAALAHERAHLDGQHHLVLAGTQGLVRAFPRVPLFVAAHREVTQLVEMLADDVAARHADRTLVATAMVALAGAATPPGALGAGGPSALVRVQRLLAPAHPLDRLRAAAGACLVGAMLLGPVAIAAAPASGIVGMTFCPTT